MPRRSEILFDLITLLMLIASVVVLGGSLLIVANPEVPFNPLPLATLPPVLEFPTATLTYTPSATFTPSFTPSLTATPSLTPTASPSNTPSPTNIPTDTPTPTITPTPVLPGLPESTPAPSNTPDPSLPVTGDGAPAQPGINIPTPGGLPPLALDTNAEFPFVVDEPVYQANSNPQGCDWLSIAGTVTGLLGEPVINLPVEVSGDGFQEVRFAGSSPLFGQSGWEINVGNAPRNLTFSVRLLGPTGEALSGFVLVETGDTCQENVTLVRFNQVREYR
jgi:hypothetical protein